METWIVQTVRMRVQNVFTAIASETMAAAAIPVPSPHKVKYMLYFNMKYYSKNESNLMLLLFLL